MTFKVGDRLKLTGYGQLFYYSNGLFTGDTVFVVTRMLGEMAVVTYGDRGKELAFGNARNFFRLAEPEKLLSYEDLL